MNLQDNESKGNVGRSSLGQVMKNISPLLSFGIFCYLALVAPTMRERAALSTPSVAAVQRNDNNLSIESPKPEAAQPPGQQKAQPAGVWHAQPAELFTQLGTEYCNLNLYLRCSEQKLLDSESDSIGDPYRLRNWNHDQLLHAYRTERRGGSASEASGLLGVYERLLQKRLSALGDCEGYLRDVRSRCSAIADLLRKPELQNGLSEAQLTELPIYRESLRLGQAHVENCERRIRRVKAQLKAMAAEIESPASPTNPSSK